MITTEYKCDKCKKVQFTSEQFWTIGVGAGAGAGAPHISVDRTIHVCRNCLEDLGYHVRPIFPSRPPPPSLEELIREILERIKEN